MENILLRFDLTGALIEYRSILIANHQRNLAGGLIEPPRAEVLRKSPMAAVPKPKRSSGPTNVWQRPSPPPRPMCRQWLSEGQALLTRSRSKRIQVMKVVSSNRPEFEKVWNTYGSSAGSGSCSIPIYYKHRRIELASRRFLEMDKDHEALQEAATFQAKREAQIQADEAATDKKRAKRQKRKDAKAKSIQMKKEADGINQFGSDGSFLEQMAKMDPKALEEEVQKTKEAAAQAAKEAALAKASTISVSQMSSAQNITIRDDDF
eukprot:s444_g14.t1